MASIDNIRNSIIDKLLTITNKEYLSALNQLVQGNTGNSDKVRLTEEQVLMLEMSEQDIANGNLIDQGTLDKEDLKWLREQ